MSYVKKTLIKQTEFDVRCVFHLGNL